MMSIALAEQLLSAGLVWEPATGDRFVVPGRDMDDEVFVVSQMVVDVHHLSEGRVIGFNGTTEWALDSLELTEVLWLPREEQLRAQLGDRFESLTTYDGEWVVTLRDGDSFRDADPETVYAKALLSVLDFAD